MKFIVIISLLFLVSNTYADQNDPYVIEYQICFGISDNLEESVVDILAATQKYLLTDNIEVSFEKSSVQPIACDPSLDNTLIFAGVFENTTEGVIDQRWIRLTLADDNINTISSLLSNELQVSLSLFDDTTHNTLALYIRYILGDIQPLEDYLLDLQDSDSDNFVVDYYLGNIAIINGDFELAVERYDNAYFTGGDWFYGTNLAWALVQIDDNQQAIEVMNWGVDYVRNYNKTSLPKLLIDRAQIYALTFDYTSAIQDMDEVIELIERDAELSQAYKQRGDIIMLIYEWNRALADYNTAIELDPNYAEAYYRRGILYYTMVERENALADFETYLELNSDGQFVASAEEYVSNIQTELDALGG